MSTATPISTEPAANLETYVYVGGLMDGHRSHTGRKIEEVSEDLKELREEVDEL